MTVLIVSGADISVEGVRARLQSRGHRVVVLHTERFPADLRLTLRADGGLVVHPVGEEAVVLTEIDAVWYRRATYRSGLPADTSVEVRRAVMNEVRAFLQGMIASQECYVLQPKWRLTHADLKPRQLSLAALAGLDVPASISTTSADAARAFVSAQGRAITKVFTGFAIEEQGQAKVVMTNAVTARDLVDLTDAELSLCPATFQEHLDKDRELRVTVVGDQLFSASVDSSQAEAGRVDWRRAPHELIDHWRVDPLPSAVAEGLLRLMDRLQLDYGAADFVVTPDGRWVFLEVNPAGEYLWTDPLFDGAISDAIADLLMGELPRRGG